MAIWTVFAAIAMQAAEPALPGWMAGCWETASDDKWTEECWTAPRAGIMLGSNRTGAGDRLEMFEMMQIGSLPGSPGMAFWAAPNGSNRTMFAWSPSNEPGVTFVNPKNEYPQRIRYWREGSDLHAEISLTDGSKAVRWRFSRPRRR